MYYCMFIYYVNTYYLFVSLLIVGNIILIYSIYIMCNIICDNVKIVTYFVLYILYMYIMSLTVRRLAGWL